MKTYLKRAGIIALVIIFLISCVAVLFGGSSFLWLHTYNVFTERTPVAQITVSELKTDQYGAYSDVKISLIKRDSAVAAIFGQADTTKQAVEPEASFRVYGDTVYISGPIIKFKDPLILINFKTIYKLGKVYGRYDLNNELEQNKPIEAQQQSSYDLNGGYSEWKNIFDNLNTKNLMGSFYGLFIDTTQISSAGIFVGGSEQKYMVYMTNLGFLWDQSE